MTNNKHADLINPHLPASCGPASGLDSATLVDVALQVYSRASRQGYPQTLHERAMECRAELIKRLQASESAAVPSLDLIRQAVARGWCSEANSSKEMDSVLALAIADEVLKLYAQPASAAVPEGWKLVPAEPTPEMMSAGGHSNSEWLNDNAPIGESRYATPMPSVYKAMLAAAPQPPAPSAKPPWTTCPDCGYDIARASAKPLPLIVSGHQLSEALEFLAPDGTDEQLGQEVCIQHGLEGLYCWLEDCPEEGSIVLIGEPLPASAAAIDAQPPSGDEREALIAKLRNHGPLEKAGLYLDAADMLAADAQRITELEALSVTNILLDVVPGDGSGLEVYAKSVADVENLLTKMGDQIEDFQGAQQVTVPQTSKVCPSCNGSKYSNRPWINLQNPGAAPPACKDCKTCKATGRIPTGEAQNQAAPEQEPEIDPCRQELHNLLNAKRFDKSVFADDTEFADWALSRARNAVYTAAPPAPQAREPRPCCEQYDTCTENCGALIETLRERLAANQTAPQAREPSDEAEQMSLGVMEHLGPAALTGGKMSILEAFELGWKARAVLAARSEP